MTPDTNTSPELACIANISARGAIMVFRHAAAGGKCDKRSLISAGLVLANEVTHLQIRGDVAMQNLSDLRTTIIDMFKVNNV